MSCVGAQLEELLTGAQDTKKRHIAKVQWACAGGGSPLNSKEGAAEETPQSSGVTPDNQELEESKFLYQSRGNWKRTHSNDS